MAEVAGCLSERVRFERRIDARGPAGERVEKWQVVCERWAEVRLAGKTGHFQEAADTYHTSKSWAMRLRAGVELIAGMRACCSVGNLMVTSVVLDPSTPRWVEVRAETYLPDSGV